MTFLSRIFGFIRDQVFAILFGVAPMTDAFFIAFKIPNLFRRFSAEGAFSQAFVPVLSEYREKRDSAASRDLIAHISGMFGGVLLLFVTLGVVAAPLFLLLFDLDKTPDQYDAAVTMLRFTFPYLLFISLVAYAGSILNSYDQFAVPAFTPVLLNVCLIVGAVFFSELTDPPIMAAAIAVLVAGVVQLLFQIPFLLRLNMLPRPRWHWRHSGVVRIFKLMLPVLFGSSVAQISLLLDTVLASFLVVGSVSWLYYSDRLVEFPVAVFGVALSTVILPRLSRQHVQAVPEKFNQTLDTAFRLGLLICLPSTLGLMLMATPILTTLFQYGAFSAHDTNMSSLSLIAYALALPGFIMIKLLTSGFFARQDTQTPVKVGLYALGAKILSSLIIVSLMLALGFAAPHVGLALSTALFAALNAILLYRYLRKQGVYTPMAGWLRFLAQIGVGLLALGAILYAVTPACRVLVRDALLAARSGFVGAHLFGRGGLPCCAVGDGFARRAVSTIIPAWS